MKKYSKRFLSLLIVLSMLTLTPLQALAQGNANEFRSGEVIALFEIDNTFIYTIELDELVYSVQIESNGLTVVSYVSEDGNVVYQSGFFYIDTFSEYDALKYEDIKNIVLQVQKKDYVPVITVKEQKKNASEISTLDADPGSDFGSGTSVSDIVEETFGSSYRNKLVKTAVRSYDKDYTFGCYESQSNTKLKNQSISVAANTAVSTIVTWLECGPFTIQLSWFLTACGVATKTVNGIKCVASAFSADAYYYEISKIRNIKQPSAPSEVLYSTWWKRKVFFVNSQKGWEHTIYSSYKHSAYDNFDNQFDLALTYLVL